MILFPSLLTATSYARGYGRLSAYRRSAGHSAQQPGTVGAAHDREGFALSQLPSIVTKTGAFLGLKSVMVSVEPGLAGVCLALSARGIELALWEILENAIKFHPTQSPQVDVSASCNGASQPCAKACLRIVDDGMTLSPGQLAQVWMPYYQAEKYHTGQVAGVGLGLSVAASLVWGVGGTCRTYNREGRPGVIVELVLPAIMDASS
jgi:K+-sensing histidine kinase KdpD